MKRTKRALRRFLVLAAAVVLFAACSLTVFADAEGTVIPGSAKIRSSADTASEALASVKANDTIQITGKTTGADGQTWYQVVDGNTKGYIRADLVKVNGTVEGTAGSDATVTQTEAEVTVADVTSGTVSSSSINVRKGPATTDAVVTSVKQGTVVQIQGQTTGADGKTWYQVAFNSNGSDVTGFVREDLLDTTTAVAASEGDGSGEEGTEEGAETEAGTESAENEEGGSTGSGYTEVNNVVSSRILPEDADLSKMEIDESKLAEWESGNYYLLYTTDTNGGKYWYLYDLSNKECKKINNLSGGEENQTAASSEGFGMTAKIVIAVLAVLVVGLIVTVTLLLLKLRDAAWEEGYDDEEDYYGEDDDEEPYEEGRVNSNRWKPRNFMRSAEERYEDEEDDEEIEDEDYEDEEPAPPVRRRPAQAAPRRRGEAMEPAPRRPVGQRVPGDRMPQDVHRTQDGQRTGREERVKEQSFSGQETSRRRTEQEASRQQTAPRAAGNRQRPAGQDERMAGRPSAQGGQRVPGGQPRQGAPRQEAAVRRPAHELEEERQAATDRGGRRQPSPEQRAARPAASAEPSRPRRQIREQDASGRQSALEEQAERRARAEQPRQKPKPQPAYYEEDDEDDEFEFEFLNMDGKDDL